MKGLGWPKKSTHPLPLMTGWWLQTFFDVHPYLGRRFPIWLTIIFQIWLSGKKKHQAFWMCFVQKTLGFSPRLWLGFGPHPENARKTQSAAAIQDAVQSCVISEESKHRFVPWKAPFFTPVRFRFFFGRRVWAGVRCRGLGVEGWLDAIQYLERCWLGLAVNF